MSLHIPLPNVSRGSATLLFHGMPFLLDESARNARNARIQRFLMGMPMEEAGAAMGDVINACKKETYKPSKLSPGPSQHVECPICLEAFEANDAILRLPCNHLFHADCLLPWIRSSHDKCPFCRAKIITKQNRSSVPRAGNVGTTAVNPIGDTIRDIPISTHPRIVSDQRQPLRRTLVFSQGPQLAELSNPFHPFPAPITSRIYPRPTSIINITSL